jgi:hypothetical protein
MLKINIRITIQKPAFKTCHYKRIDDGRSGSGQRKNRKNILPMKRQDVHWLLLSCISHAVPLSDP